MFVSFHVLSCLSVYMSHHRFSSITLHRGKQTKMSKAGVFSRARRKIVWEENCGKPDAREDLHGEQRVITQYAPNTLRTGTQDFQPSLKTQHFAYNGWGQLPKPKLARRAQRLRGRRPTSHSGDTNWCVPLQNNPAPVLTAVDYQYSTEQEIQDCIIIKVNSDDGASARGPVTSTCKPYEDHSYCVTSAGATCWCCHSDWWGLCLWSEHWGFSCCMWCDGCNSYTFSFCSSLALTHSSTASASSTHPSVSSSSEFWLCPVASPSTSFPTTRPKWPLSRFWKSYWQWVEGHERNA